MVSKYVGLGHKALMLLCSALCQPAQQDEARVHMFSHIRQELSEQVPGGIRTDADEYALRGRSRPLVTFEVIAIYEDRGIGWPKSEREIATRERAYPMRLPVLAPGSR